MSYPVRFKDIEIVVGSLDEAAELTAKLAKLATNGHSPAGAASTRETASPQRGRSSISEFVASLNEAPKAGLRLIARNEGPISAEALCRAMHVNGNSALAGRVISPISRYANRAGIDPSDIVIALREIASDGSSELKYAVPDDSLDEVLKGLEM